MKISHYFFSSLSFLALLDSLDFLDSLYPSNILFYALFFWYMFFLIGGYGYENESPGRKFPFLPHDLRAS